MQQSPDSGHLHLVQRDPEVGLADLDEVVLQLRELLHEAVEDLGGGRQQTRTELLVQPRILKPTEQFCC